MNKILVTGGFGRLGLPLVNELVGPNLVYVIDNMNNPDSLERFGQINFRAKITYTDIVYSQHIWNDVKFNTVVHLATYTDETNADSDYTKVFKDCILGTMHIIKRCIKDGSKLIYVDYSRDSNRFLKFMHDDIIRMLAFYSESGLDFVVIPSTGLINDDIRKSIISAI